MHLRLFSLNGEYGIVGDLSALHAFLLVQSASPWLLRRCPMQLHDWKDVIKKKSQDSHRNLHEFTGLFCGVDILIGAMNDLLKLSVDGCAFIS